MQQLSFRERVEAKYLILEQEEITAGWKNILKKGLGVLLGGLLFSQSAFGFHIKDEKLKKLESDMRKTMQEYTMDKNSNTEGAKYDYKIDTSKKGGFQKVMFKVIKNGKVAGQINFLGTKGSKSFELNQVDARMTDDGKNDVWVKTVVDTQAKGLQDMVSGK